MVLGEAFVKGLANLFHKENDPAFCLMSFAAIGVCESGRNYEAERYRALITANGTFCSAVVLFQSLKN